MIRFLALFFFATSALAQTWTCESPNDTYRECRIGSGGVIKLVMEMSERRCFEGLTWGTREGGIVWVNRGCRATFTVDNGDTNRRIVCESQDGKRQICLVDPINDVALLQQVSQAPCIEFQTWGFNPDRNQIWVDRGCRGQFILAKTGAARRATSNTRMLEGIVVCESNDRGKKRCAADTTAGVQIIRNLSEDNCRFGREWNYDASGIWVSKGCRAEFAIKATKPRAHAMTCESRNNANEICLGDTRFGIDLVRQFGNNPCILGKTWGFDTQGVWVTDGCRALFALGGYRIPEEEVPPTATKMVCASADGARIQCPADTKEGVGLIRQLSESDCVLNRNWGYDRAGIWVSEGCRAEFAVGR
jgi:hypothetical protein